MTTVEVLDNGLPQTSGNGSLSLADRIKADATRVEYEIDAAGRRIGVKKLTFLDVHELTRVLKEDANNQAALQQALMVGSVVEIDGDPVARPTTDLQLKALMKRLDFHGVTAATTAMGRFQPLEPVSDTAIKN